MAARLRRLEAYATALGALKRWRRVPEWARAALVGTICVAVAGLLWALRIAPVHLTVDVETRTLTMVLANPWSLDRTLPMREVRVERADVLAAPGLPLSVRSGGGDAWLHVEGGDPQLGKLRIGHNASILLEGNRHGVSLFVRGAGLGGELTVARGTSLSTGEGPGASRCCRQVISGAFPETIEFSASGQGEVATVLHARPARPWSLRGFRPAAMDFAEERPAEPGLVAFGSAIVRGTVRLHEVLLEHALRDGDRLRMRGVGGRVVEISGGEEGLRLVFDGVVREVGVGPPGLERNLAPSYLEYLYHRRPLAFFWSSVVFLWGLLWGVRGTIFR